MSMTRDLKAAWSKDARVDVGLSTGQQFRGTVVAFEESDNDLSDCATITLQPNARNDTAFIIAVPHIVFVRPVNESNQFYPQAPRM